jgi:pimeloyl-ACP methyl ester carboxylesterase
MTSPESSTSANAPSITEHELAQCQRANQTGRTPLVFVHGLWLLPSSWDRWAALFEDSGYVALTPGWPDDPETVQEATAHPEVFAGKSIGQVADHYQTIIGGLDQKPAIIGHSFGGLLTQILAGRGLAKVSVAIDPAPFRGVLPLPISVLKSGSPVLHNPANRNRAVPLTYDQFRYGFANAVSEDEARQLYEQFAVPAAGKRCSRRRPPEPLDRGQGRHPQPRAGAAADHLGGAGPHRALGHRQRLLPAGGGQPGCDRDRGDQGPRARPDDRQRLAGGRRHRPDLRPTLHLTGRPGRPARPAGPGQLKLGCG